MPDASLLSLGPVAVTSLLVLAPARVTLSSELAAWVGSCSHDAGQEGWAEAEEDVLAWGYNRPVSMQFSVELNPL